MALDWFIIDLSSVTEIDQTIRTTIPNRGQMDLRFVLANGKIGWIINGNALFEDYFQTPDGKYGFYRWEGSYQIGFEAIV